MEKKRNMCLALDPVTHDLILDKDGNFIEVYEDEATASCIQNTLLVWKGEWFLNKEHGTKYSRIFGPRSSTVTDEDIREVVREAVFQEKNVQRVEEIEITRDDRALSLQITAVLWNNHTITMEVSV